MISNSQVALGRHHFGVSIVTLLGVCIEYGEDDSCGLSSIPLHCHDDYYTNQVIPQMCPGELTCIVDEDDTMPSCLCDSNSITSTVPENITCLRKLCHEENKQACNHKIIII